MALKQPLEQNSEKSCNSKNNHRFVCYICPVSSLNKKYKTKEAHFSTEEHQLTYKAFQKLFDEVESNVKCKNCSKECSKQVIIQHAMKHKIPPWYKPKDLNKKFFNHFIGNAGNKYKCYVCNEQFSFWYLALKHISTNDHIVHRADNIPKDSNKSVINQWNSDYFNLLVEHDVFLKKNGLLECKVCKVFIYSFKNIDEHIKGRTHKEKKLAMNKGISESLNYNNSYRKRKKNKRRHQNAVEKSNGSEPREKDANEYQCKASPYPLRQLKTLVQLTNKDTFEKVQCEICEKICCMGIQYHIHLSGHFSEEFPLNENNNITTFLSREKRSTLDLKEVTQKLSDLTIETETKKHDEETKLKNDKNSKIHSVGAILKDDFTLLATDSEDYPIDWANILPNEEVDEIYHISEEKMMTISVSACLTFKKKDGTYCLVCRESIKGSDKFLYEHFCSIKHLNYLEEMENDYALYKNYPNFISDIELGKEYMEDISDIYVTCYACDQNVPNEFEALRDHIKNDIHIKMYQKLRTESEKLETIMKIRMQPNYYNTGYFWCVPCGEIFKEKRKFSIHLTELKHKEKCEKLKLQKYDKIIFDYCALCATLFYGFMRTYGYHSRCKYHRYFLEQSFYNQTALPKSARKILENPEEESEKILQKNDLKKESRKARNEKILESLKYSIKHRYPDAKIYPFGSSVTGLGSAESDLDIFVDYNGKMYGKQLSTNDIEGTIKCIEKCLKNIPPIWSINKTVLNNTRVPIIKIIHKPTETECDISVSSGISTENTKLIKSFIDNYPPLRRLILFIKKWINNCELGAPNGLNSYTITWIVIFYLQSTGILPTVEALMKSKCRSKTVAGWKCSESTEFTLESSEEDFLKLLKEFFIFYYKFNYKDYIICPLIGYPLSRKAFDNKLELPQAMNSYIKQIESKKGYRFENNAPLCVQDPYDLSHNISHNFEKVMVYRLRTFCYKSFKLLESHSTY